MADESEVGAVSYKLDNFAEVNEVKQIIDSIPKSCETLTQTEAALERLTGPEERTCQDTGDMNSEEFTFNLFEDIADDSTAKNSGFYVKLSPNTSHDAEEDWDREIISQFETEKKNEFLSLLSTYPPASQAFTPTATYQSLLFDTACKSTKNNNLYDTCQQAVFIQGQFDDAD